MPRSVQRKSATIDLLKLARRQGTYPYNLRTRNRCTNYNEIHLSHSGWRSSQQGQQTSLKLLSSSISQSDTSSQSLHLRGVETPCSSNSLESSHTVLPQQSRHSETTTLYVNEDFGKSAKSSSIEIVEDEEVAEETEDPGSEDDAHSANTIDLDGTAENHSDDAALSDTSYRRNYSASAYGYDELIGHSNVFHLTRSASQAGVRPEIDLGENLRDFDAFATGDGGHNDPNILEFSVRILDNEENYF